MLKEEEKEILVIKILIIREILEKKEKINIIF